MTSTSKRKADARRKADELARRYTAYAITCELRANGLAEGYFHTPDATPAEQAELRKALNRLARRLSR